MAVGFRLKSKIWIEDEEGKAVFGAGRQRILDAVARHGSILAASQELEMSYRAVWGKIRATEKRMGKPLLTSKAGGPTGGGSELTPLALTLVEKFNKLQSLTNEAADAFFRELFGPEPD
jgi:molybdate transport system regulatory protein